MIKQMRSGFASENLQEILDASSSVKAALQQGQNQYETPEELADAFHSLLPNKPSSIFDPQCASGHLLNARPTQTLYGWDIDNRFADNKHESIVRVTGNCVKVDEIVQDLYPNLKFACIVANPPFALRWKLADGETMDSTEWTWKFIGRRLASGGVGFFMSNWKTIEKLNIHNHPWVYLYQKFPGGLWDNCDVELGVVHFCTKPITNLRAVKEWDHLPTRDEILREVGAKLEFRNTPYVSSNYYYTEFGQLEKIITEEEKTTRKWNIYLTEAGMLRTYLSTRKTLKLQNHEIIQLSRIQDCHPLTLTTEKETRQLMNTLLTCGLYTIQPEAEAAIKAALIAVHTIAAPIRPVTDFEVVAYADTEETLATKTALPSNLSPHIAITTNKKYDITTGTYKFTQSFTRKKLHWDEETHKTELMDHVCELSGADRYIQIKDDKGDCHRFMDRPSMKEGEAGYSSSGLYREWPEEMLWEIFEKPEIKTIKELHPELYKRNLQIMATCESLAGYAYYEGQKDYYARMGCKNYGLVAADVGTGKSLGALTLIALKSPKRTLLIAPQGTMRGSEDEEEQDYDPSQWVKEINRFAPAEPVFQVFSLEDWRAIRHANGGEAPPGIYITYPQAMFQNNAFEVLPSSWEEAEESDAEQEQKFCKRMNIAYDENRPRSEWYSTGLGEISARGIRCVAEPCLATIISTEMGEWDMVIIDEAHLCCNLHAQVTRNLIRLQPKYRFAMTATPIPNIVSNIFSLMGWLCVDQWYIGGKRNAAWPYAVNEIGRFNGTFLSFEEDLTAKELAKQRGKKNPKSVKISPVISSPARLLKLLKPTMAYISKEDCNPNVVKCEVIDVRVPMGTQQAALYSYWLDRGNYYPEFKSALTIARVQQSRLRGITTAPRDVDYNRGMCKSNFNPKLAAILQLIMQCIEKGEQVTVVSARVDQSSEIAMKLRDANIPISRIDSTVQAHLHTAEANRFKRGDSRVQLMGIKCAQGHSFDLCPNLIIGSLEWSYGTLHQAKGRVWRLNSRKDVKVWCVLHKGTIEELLFDRVALKQDAATLCLMGRRVPRDFKTMDPAEILAEHMFEFDDRTIKTVAEFDSERGWGEVRRRLSVARNMHLIDRPLSK